jgi:hypothetical protein
LTIATIIIALTALLIGGFLYLNRPQLVTFAGSVPAQFPADGFSHTVFESLLQRYVDAAGNVDYQAWHGSSRDVELLGDYLAAVAATSPDMEPDRFASRYDSMAYWLYAYNAYVVRSVIAHWPLESVTDVRAPIEAVTGLGFFYQQRFMFGGEALSLYAVEHDKILANYRDPRVHFVLNCASESCPVLRPELPVGDELEVLLEASADDFVNDGRNVHVDHDGRRIVLNTIFRWYRKDFLNDLRRRGLPGERGVVDYIAAKAGAELHADLEKSAGYEIVYDDYDWALNVQEN